VGGWGRGQPGQGHAKVTQGRRAHWRRGTGDAAGSGTAAGLRRLSPPRRRPRGAEKPPATKIRSPCPRVQHRVPGRRTLSTALPFHAVTPLGGGLFFPAPMAGDNAPWGPHALGQGCAGDERVQVVAWWGVFFFISLIFCSSFPPANGVETNRARFPQARRRVMPRRGAPSPPTHIPMGLGTPACGCPGTSRHGDGSGLAHPRHSPSGGIGKLRHGLPSPPPRGRGAEPGCQEEQGDGVWGGLIPPAPFRPAAAPGESRDFLLAPRSPSKGLIAFSARL